MDSLALIGIKRILLADIMNSCFATLLIQRGGLTRKRDTNHTSGASVNEDSSNKYWLYGTHLVFAECAWPLLVRARDSTSQSAHEEACAAECVRHERK